MRPALALALVVASCSSPSSGTPADPHPPLAMAMPAAALTTGPLEIHQINVQQGDCTLIVRPDGTTFLIDAGNVGKGTSEVVPYLQSLGINPADGLDFVLATHGDSDHLGGLDEVLNANYDVREAIWFNGSSKTGDEITEFFTACQGKTAGTAQPMPLGHVVQLGGDATATCVAVGGQVLGHGQVTGATEENDLSVATLVQHGAFEYLTAGDLGGGDSDRSCTGRSTEQADVETPLALSRMPGGGAALLTDDGIEVPDVNHHGNESSTNRIRSEAPSCVLLSTGSRTSYPQARYAFGRREKNRPSMLL